MLSPKLQFLNRQCVAAQELNSTSSLPDTTGKMAIMHLKAAAISMAILLLCVASGAQARDLHKKQGAIVVSSATVPLSVCAAAMFLRMLSCAFGCIPMTVVAAHIRPANSIHTL